MTVCCIFYSSSLKTAHYTTLLLFQTLKNKVLPSYSYPPTYSKESSNVNKISKCVWVFLYIHEQNCIFKN